MVRLGIERVLGTDFEIAAVGVPKIFAALGSVLLAGGFFHDMCVAQS